MTKQKSTKRALLMSALSLLLCVSMLIGSTFAWFTDSVVSGNNKIVAGNLDIDLYKVELKDDWFDHIFDTNFDPFEEVEITEDSDPIFSENILWEPGYTKVANLKLVNNGSLALKYRAVIRPVGVVGELAEVIDVFTCNEIINEASGRDSYEDKLVKVGTLKDVMAGTAMIEGEMKNTGDVKFFSIVLKMQEEAGNEYQGKEAGAFDITILATQNTYESDSFDDQYDKDAMYPGEVGSAQDLMAAVAKGESVKLLNDIELSAVLSVKTGDSVIIDLNGKTLAGCVEIEDGAALAVANGTVSNTNAEVSALQTNGGKVILNDVVVESARHGVRAEGGSVTINGGTYKVVPTTKKTQHAVNISDGATVVINGGTFIGPKGTMADSGSAVNVQAGSACTINGGSFSGGKNSTLAAKGTLAVFGGTFDQDPSAFISKGSQVVNNGNGTYTVKGYEVQTNDDLSDLIENGNSNLSLPEGEIETNLKVPAGSNIVIEGKGEETVLNGQIATTSSTEGTIILRNLTVNVSDAINDSTGISQTGKSAIAIWGNQTVICENVTFNMDLANSTAITSWWDTGIGTSIVVRNCTFNCNGNRPIRATGNVTVENCTFNDPYRYAVQLTAKASTADLLDKAIINFNNNTIVNGENGKNFVYGIQLEGADYGCHDCVINGENNTIVNGGTDSAMYYCECGKVEHATIEWNVEVAPVHEN